MIRPREIRRLRREGRQLLQMALHPLIVTGPSDPTLTVRIEPLEWRRVGDRCD